MKRSLSPQTILLPSPVMVVGTYGLSGNPNMLTVAWGGIASSKPPCISVSLRKATLSYNNIKQSKAFTVNIPSETYYKEVDFAGMVSGKECDKFGITRLTPVRSKKVNAPIVGEFPVALECKLVQAVELGSHTMFIGEIVGLVADGDSLNKYQLPDIEKVRPLFWGSFGSMAYYGIGTKLGNAFSAGNEILQPRK